MTSHKNTPLVGRSKVWRQYDAFLLSTEKSRNFFIFFTKTYTKSGLNIFSFCKIIHCGFQSVWWKHDICTHWWAGFVWRHSDAFPILLKSFSCVFHDFPFSIVSFFCFQQHNDTFFLEFDETSPCTFPTLTLFLGLKPSTFHSFKTIHNLHEELLSLSLPQAKIFFKKIERLCCFAFPSANGDFSLNCVADALIFRLRMLNWWNEQWYRLRIAILHYVFERLYHK